MCLPRARYSPTPSQPISSRSTAILPSHSSLGLPSGPFLSGFPVKRRMPSSYNKSQRDALFLRFIC
jgi:hypothetical protein